MTANLTVLHVVGARPNFTKTAPVLRALEAVGGVRNVLVHTGQHYDSALSDVFFRDLDIREPDVHLGVGSGSHGQQTAAVLGRIEPVIRDYGPDLVMVVGDVNSTLAAALAAVKLGVPVAHVEAGLRSRDRSMPEEINRLVTDQISDLLFTPSRDADLNLLSEGLPRERIHFVGNVLIDTLLDVLPALPRDAAERRWGVERAGYVVATLHRPCNVDHAGQLREIFHALDDIASEMPVIMPMHPRTAARAQSFGLGLTRVRVSEPVTYREMLALLRSAALVLTDSGGVQEETTVLGVPCLTLRPNTERPVTLTEGTNRLVTERKRAAIALAFRDAAAAPASPARPDRWDGKASGTRTPSRPGRVATSGQP